MNIDSGEAHLRLFNRSARRRKRNQSWGNSIEICCESEKWRSTKPSLVSSTRPKNAILNIWFCTWIRMLNGSGKYSRNIRRNLSKWTITWRSLFWISLRRTLKSLETNAKGKRRRTTTTTTLTTFWTRTSMATDSTTRGSTSARIATWNTGTTRTTFDGVDERGNVTVYYWFKFWTKN